MQLQFLAMVVGSFVWFFNIYGQLIYKIIVGLVSCVDEGSITQGKADDERRLYAIHVISYKAYDKKECRHAQIMITYVS